MTRMLASDRKGSWWTVQAEPLPAHPYPATYNTWLANAVLTAKHHGARWAAGAYSATIDNAIIFGQYEPWYGFRRMAEHLGGDAELTAYVNAAEAAWLPYTVKNSGKVPGYYNYTDGFSLSDNPAARNALVVQSRSAAYATGSSLAIMKAEWLSREVAYAVLGYINAEVYCGAARNDRLASYLELMLGDGGHIEQWLGGIQTDDSGNIVAGTESLHRFADGKEGFAPFMGAITAWSLIATEKLGPLDGRIIPKLTRLFDAMWSFYWLPGGMKYRWVSTTAATALNNEMAPIYCWLYLKTGQRRFLERGDALFDATAKYDSLTSRGTGTATYLSKEFNELIRWTFDGLQWRAEGVTKHGSIH